MLRLLQSTHTKRAPCCKHCMYLAPPYVPLARGQLSLSPGIARGLFPSHTVRPTHPPLAACFTSHRGGARPKRGDAGGKGRRLLAIGLAVAAGTRRLGYRGAARLSLECFSNVGKNRMALGGPRAHGLQAPLDSHQASNAP